MNAQAALDRLRSALNTPLPGHDAFMELSGYERPDVARAMAQRPAPRESAVLALFYPKDDVVHTLLMLRPTYDGVHSGQIGFPGGKQEPEDASLEQTALREFNEETGAYSTEVELVGRLSPIYIPPSRTLVTPFVGVASELGPVRPDPTEVAELIETPLERLLRDDILKRREQMIATLGRSMEVPYFDVDGHVVWGATAMMIAELRELFLR